jgi:serine/threonine-protein kinase HipA
MNNPSIRLFYNGQNSFVDVPLTTGTTSNGILMKGVINIEGTVYFIKTGSVNGAGIVNPLQSISESMASKIGKLLGVNCIEYSLVKARCNIDGEGFSEETLVCASKNFLNVGESFVSMYKFLDVNYDSLDLYKHIIDKFPDYQTDINNMIVFDYIINNSDRHLNNFGFIVDSDSKEIKRFCSLFDHGLSLYSEIGDYEFKYITEESLFKYNRCQPFTSRHTTQIKKAKYTTVDLNISEHGIDTILSGYKNILSEKRIKSIKNLLIRRITNARKIPAKRQE